MEKNMDKEYSEREKIMKYNDEAIEQNEREKEGEAVAIEEGLSQDDGKGTSDTLVLKSNEVFDTLIKITEDINKRAGTGPKKSMTMDEKAEEKNLKTLR